MAGAGAGEAAGGELLQDQVLLDQTSRMEGNQRRKMMPQPPWLALAGLSLA